MSSFPEGIFHLKIDNSYLDIEESKNPLNQHRVICSAIKNDTTQLWYFNEGTIKHHQTKENIFLHHLVNQDYQFSFGLNTFWPHLLAFLTTYQKLIFRPLLKTRQDRE